MEPQQQKKINKAAEKEGDTKEEEEEEEDEGDDYDDYNDLITSIYLEKANSGRFVVKSCRLVLPALQLYASVCSVGGG